ncbi:hypothetical protein J2752_002243 [Halarchaeum rubridurum]|uniref:Uncharacterized protein n=1 Tax=Halarchaeum rubridurum TaxID=489911 RepID=A0A830G219_9EURY|nr:hypothetical protein [Halarchaeum rubridurum]MBP1955320.1 hypothetical protein [Halarchaeum rubridurum]GGM71410.1 hypothetical protein GCM10009017_21750 [Halarchaeum rubridurum]
MPLSVDSTAWERGTEPETLKAQVLTFLVEHAGEAYTVDELADELLDTTFSEQRARRERQASEPESLPNGRGAATELGEVIASRLRRDYLKREVVELSRDGHIEARDVDAGAVDAEYADEGTVGVYAYLPD